MQVYMVVEKLKKLEKIERLINLGANKKYLGILYGS